MTLQKVKKTRIHSALTGEQLYAFGDVSVGTPLVVQGLSRAHRDADLIVDLAMRAENDRCIDQLRRSIESIDQIN